jgi:O-antigen ligase
MTLKKTSNNQNKTQTFIESVKLLFNKELLIGLYLLLFIVGITIGSGYGVYNEFRITQIGLLLGLGIGAWFYNRDFVTKSELLFLAFIVLGGFFWDNALFVIADLLLAYLLYKSFYLLEYRSLLTKIIVLSSLLIFLLLPVALWDYINSGTYSSEWYALRLNIRIYNSYFLILSIFAVWFFLTEKHYRNLYLIFLFLAFLSILVDGGRSAALAYSAFIAIICVFNRPNRWQLLAVYGMSWLTYLSVTYLANLNVTNAATLDVQIVRATSSQRYDIWVNAVQCWSQNPLLGCGFYQLDTNRTLAAHPHNIFIQSLTETGLVGFGFLIAIVVAILKNIDWNIKSGYFVIAALVAVSIDMSLSGVHIYPMTQLALLWLFVFLLKNPDFSHAQYFNRVPTVGSASDRFLSIAIYLILTVFFVYLFITTTAIVDNELFSRPRFWQNGYRLF